MEDYQAEYQERLSLWTDAHFEQLVDDFLCDDADRNRQFVSFFLKTMPPQEDDKFADFFNEHYFEVFTQWTKQDDTLKEKFYDFCEGVYQMQGE